MACIRTFFRRRFRFETPYYPKFKEALEDESVPRFELDVAVEASGWGKNDEGKLRKLLNEQDKLREEEGESSEEENSDEGEESDEDDGKVDEADERGETREQEMARLIAEAAGPSQPPTLVPRTDLNDEDDEEEEEGDSLAPLPTSHDAPPSPTSMPVLASAFQRVSFTTRPAPSVAPSSRSLLPGSADIKNTVTSEMLRGKAQAEAKHHSRVAPGKMGQAKGTKKKNEGKARLMKAERSGANDDW